MKVQSDIEAIDEPFWELRMWAPTYGWPEAGAVRQLVRGQMVRERGR